MQRVVQTPYVLQPGERLVTLGSVNTSRTSPGCRSAHREAGHDRPGRSTAWPPSRRSWTSPPSTWSGVVVLPRRRPSRRRAAGPSPSATPSCSASASPVPHPGPHLPGRRRRRPGAERVLAARFALAGAPWSSPCWSRRWSSPDAAARRHPGPRARGGLASGWRRAPHSAAWSASPAACCWTWCRRRTARWAAGPSCWPWRGGSPAGPSTREPSAFWPILVVARLVPAALLGYAAMGCARRPAGGRAAVVLPAVRTLYDVILAPFLVPLSAPGRRAASRRTAASAGEGTLVAAGVGPGGHCLAQPAPTGRARSRSAAREEPRRERSLPLRLIVMQVLVVSLLLTLLGRLWFLQVFSAPSTSRRPTATGSARSSPRPSAARSWTTRVASWSATAPRWWSRSTARPGPAQEGEREAVVARLAKQLKMPGRAPTSHPLRHQGRRREVAGVLERDAVQPIPVAKDVSQRWRCRSWRAEDYPGVAADLEAQREYPEPYGANAAHELGYVGPGDAGWTPPRPRTRSPRRPGGPDRAGGSYDAFLRGERRQAAVRGPGGTSPAPSDGADGRRQPRHEHRRPGPGGARAQLLAAIQRARARPTRRTSR